MHSASHQLNRRTPTEQKYTCGQFQSETMDPPSYRWSDASFDKRWNQQDPWFRFEIGHMCTSVQLEFFCSVGGRRCAPDEGGL